MEILRGFKIDNVDKSLLDEIVASRDEGRTANEGISRIAKVAVDYNNKPKCRYLRIFCVCFPRMA